MTTYTVGSGLTYPTIDAAMDAVGPGDTIVLSAGYHSETATVTIDNLTIDGEASSTDIILQLAPNVSGLTLTGSAPINVLDSVSGGPITGNMGDNEITVSGGNDIVDGGGGTGDRLVVDYSAAIGTTTGTSTTSFTGVGVGSVNITGSGFEHYDILMGKGINTIITADGDDVIVGTGIVANTIVAGEGNNQVQTGDGIDTISTGSGDDRILSGDGASTIITTGGDNFIKGGSGIDTILVGDGNDIILGGDGANTITGLGGDKSILTGDGIDTITLTDGNNLIVSGDGASTTVATDGNNVICAGDGVDTITLGNGDNIVNAKDGANTVTVGGGQNVVWGGDGIDTITAGGGGSYVDGGGGPANTLTTGAGADTVVSGTGIDTITTGDGDDAILIKGGADVIAAGAGSDTLVIDYSATTVDVTNSAPTGTSSAGYAGNLSGMGAVTYSGVEKFDITTGLGNDTITGGDSDDIIDTGTGDDNVSAGGGSDYIYGNGGDTIDGGEGGPFDIDTLNLGLGNEAKTDIIFTDASGVPTPLNVVSESGVVTFTDTGETLTFTNIENIVYNAPLDPTITLRAPDPNMCTVPCFTPGTLISTVSGTRLIESLEVGDRVLTRDNGFKKIIWVGTKRVTRKELQANDALQPVLIRRGSLGDDCPNRDMMVSRQHRLLIADVRAMLLFGSNEVIVKAKHLVLKPGIEALELDSVTYVHIMFDQHEIILADGAWTESFQPGDSSVSGLDADQVHELETIFPELSEASRFAHVEAARLSLKSYETSILLA